MDRGAKPANAKSNAKPRAARQSRTNAGSEHRGLEQRLAEALEQQAATSEILRVISSAQTDVQPVFDAIVRNAVRLCNADHSIAARFDGEHLHPLAYHGFSPEALEITARTFPMRPSMANMLGRATLKRAVDNLPDMLADSEYSRDFALAGGWRSGLAVPMFRDEQLIGAIAVSRTVAGAFPEHLVTLLKTFADQAVIAIENVRLFKELEARNADLTDALEQQTATSEILRAIASSPADIQPVLETVVRAAAQFCGAPDVVLLRRDDGVLRGTAAVGTFADVLTRHLGHIEALEIPLTRGSVAGRAALECRSVHVHDLAAESEDEYPVGRELQRRFGHRTNLATPLLREGVALGVIGLFHTEVKPFSDKQVALLQTFADQAVIAIENVRLFNALKARNSELAEALEQQTATSEVLKVISRSAFELEPVFETLVENAVRLCDADKAFIYQFDGAVLRLEAAHNASPELREFVQRHPISPGRHSASARAALEKRTVHVPDAEADSEYTYGLGMDPIRTILGVPMLKGDHLVGVITIYRLEVKPFTNPQIALIETFADQAVIAIENVRLFKELEARNRDLSEALEQQTATSEILRVISQSPTDVQPVFDTIAAAAMNLCRAHSVNVVTFDGELIHLAALANLTPEGADSMRQLFPRRPGRDIGSTRAVLTGQVVAIPDVLEDPDYALPAAAVAGRFRSVLAVPLLREGNPIGAIGVGREERGRFPDKQIALLQTFADQAVIAIENVRLFKALEARNRDLTEALEQQTATSEILRVISQSQTDVQPVFDTIVAAALKLCRASSANVFTFDGELLHLAALVNVNPEYVAALRQLFPRPPSRDTAVTRAVMTNSVVAIPDVLEDRDYAIGTHSLTGGFRSILAVPLLREGHPIGAITVGRPEPGPFSDNEIALLQTFADQAVIAIENVRLFRELEARTTQLTQSVGELKALGEVGQAVSSTLDLETVLSTIVSRATQLAGMDGGSIYEYDETREEFYLHTTDGLPEELVEALRATPIPKGEGALGRMAVTGEPVQIRDIIDEGSYQSRVREILIRCGYQSLLAVPLLRDDHLLGGLVVNRNSAGVFAPQVIDLLKTFAAQSALAIQNARLFREIESKSRQLEIASQHKSEFLANMSHELRTPLNAIIGFSEVLSERMFGEINEKQAEYLTDILDSGRHLLSLINDILDLSKIEAGRMELEPTDFNLPDAIENALILVRERANRHAISLGRTVDERLGMVRADERKVKQVLLNLLSNALKFTPKGGRIDVHADIHDGAARIAVTDTGVGIAPEEKEAVFEEFRQVGVAAKKVEGTGLGLAISRKIIELHGGRIWVNSELGKGSTFTFTIPVHLEA